jgi:Mg-chelatase subunit ChlD
MRACKHILAALAVALVLAAPILADTRKANIDVIIALDKSLSMEDKIGAVKTWVNSFILDQLIIPGDTLTVIAFYGKADLLISQTITSDADRAAAKALISRLRGDGRFTDIGNALDEVKAQLANKETDGREKYVLLLTDGIQEAPPSSKYWSKNGTFNHEFLSNTKTIQQKGWKVMILGIGIDTAAKQLAQELQGSYSEITTTLTPQTIATTAGTLFGMPSIDGPVVLRSVTSRGSSEVQFTLKPSGMAGDVQITVNDVAVQAASQSFSGLLPSPATLTVKKDGSTRVRIPLLFPADLAPGSSPGTLTFSFSSTQRFAPAQVPVTLQVMGWVQSNLLLLGGALVLLLAVAALVVLLIWRLTRGRPLRFAVLVDDMPVQDDPATLRTGRELFLNDLASVISLAPRRTGKSVAKFAVREGRLGLTALKADRFPKLKEFPPEVRGKSFVLRTESGKNVTLKVQSKERKK